MIIGNLVPLDAELKEQFQQLFRAVKRNTTALAKLAFQIHSLPLFKWLQSHAQPPNATSKKGETTLFDLSQRPVSDSLFFFQRALEKLGAWGASVSSMQKSGRGSVWDNAIPNSSLWPWFPRAPALFYISCISFGTFVLKPDHVVDLERRQKALEDEVAKASLHCATDDPMILDLKRRILHLRDELETFRHKAIADRRLH